MHAVLVGDEGLRALAVRLHQELLPVAPSAGDGNIGVIYRRFGVAAGENSCAPPWQSWQLAAVLPGGVVLAWRAVRIGILRIGMALGAENLLRRGLVRQALHVLVAIHASEHMEPWIECFSFFASTKSDTVLPFTSVVRVESEWQARQSSSLSLCWARVGRAEPSRKNASVQNRILLENFTQ